MFEHSKKTFLAINDVLGTGESIAGQECTLSTHSSCPRINCVLHVGQLACRHRPWTKCARRADADSGDHLVWRQIQHPAGGNWRRECAQRSMMPSVLAHAWPSDFAQRQRRSDEIAGVTWIGFPIDVVVIHRANHVAI